MPSTHYHTAEDMRDSIEGLFMQHGTQRPWIYWSLLLVTAAAVTALPLVKVDTSVGAAGQIRPAVERLRVFPAVSGRVRVLRVRDNQAIEANEVLLVLDSTAIDARIEQNRTERTENDRALSDLEALLARPDAISPETTSESNPPAQPIWRQLYLQSAPYMRQQAVLQSDLQRLSLQFENAQQELHRFAALHSRGLVTEQDFAQKQFSTRTVRREMELLVQQTLSRWQSDRLERELRSGSLRSEAEQLEQQRALYTVRAPVDGIAIGFTDLQVGLFVPSDQLLGEISPSGELQADVYLSPRDVGFVRVDQSVNLQIDAFPYTEWGTVRGRVRSISQDFVQIGQQIAFKAVIDLETIQLRSATGSIVALRRGMTTQARFILQRRTLFNLLFGKMSEALDPRARESAS